MIRTTARLPRTGVLDGGAETGDHPLRRPFTDAVQSVIPQAAAHGVVAENLVQGHAESRRITLGDDEAVDAVLNQPAGRRPDGVARDHGNTLVERLVDDEPPRLLALRS